MDKKVADIIKDWVTDWLFSPQGTIAFALLWSGVLALFTYLTRGLDRYEPVAYLIAVGFGFISILIVIRLLLSIYKAVTESVKTSAPTFVEYKIENNTLVLTKKANIHNEPQSKFLNHTFFAAPSLEVTGKGKKAKSYPIAPAPQNIPAFQHLGAQIVVVFDKPLASIHLQIEQIAGQVPTKGNHTIDSRFATLELNGIRPDSAFRIRFN